MGSLRQPAALPVSNDDTPAGPASRRRPRPRRLRMLTGRDRSFLALLIGIPLIIHVGLVWIPTIGSILLSFTHWSGIGGWSEIRFVGVDNYVSLVTTYPTFFPALRNNVLWLVVFLFVVTPIGIAIAVLLDKGVRGSRFYESAIYLPFVLSLAVVGFIWQLQYAPETGFINNVIGATDPGETISWLGDRRINIWSVLVAAGWRHVGYVMVIYLAALKSVDPTLKEAAMMDGASEAQTFFRVIVPVLKPINVVVIVITFIESLRAFDIVWVINRGRNGLELLSVLVTQNILGASSRVGFGSAIATVLFLISVVPIVIFLKRMHEAPA